MSSDEDQKPSKRILVLGSAPHTRHVTAYNWDELPKDLNVADYEAVILNFCPLEDREDNSWEENFPAKEQFIRLIFSQSEIIAIGTPIFRPNSVIGWLPILPSFHIESGEMIQHIDQEFEYYFKKVRRWSFHGGANLVKSKEEASLAQIIDPGSNIIMLISAPLAQTLSGEPVAFKLQFRLYNNTNEAEANASPRRNSGRTIFWLPSTTEISDYEAVNLILHERYGLLQEGVKPEWVEAYPLPKQPPIETEIDLYKQMIQELEIKVTETQQRLEEVTRFQKILYETGEDVLEPVVRDALRELGAEVEDPKEKGKEDGRLVDPSGRNGMLEIKGPQGSLKLRDVRQLDQWVRDTIAEEEWESKGILIANTYHKRPLNEREKPFPDNCVKTAIRFEICLMTTTQLFRALVYHQRGELDLDDFWKTIFGTNGVCDLPELEYQAIPKGNDEVEDQTEGTNDRRSNGS